MIQRPQKSRCPAGRAEPTPDPITDLLIPVVDEIRTAIGELRERFDEAVAELRRRIEGQHKSHYTIEEVAALTGRAPYTVRSWVKDGLIAATRIQGTGPKGRLLVPHGEIQRLVAAGRGRRLSPVAASDSAAPIPRSPDVRAHPEQRMR